MRASAAASPRVAVALAALSAVATFHFVCLAWVVFRADTVGGAFAVVRQIARGSVDTSNLPAAALVVGAVGFAAHFAPELFSRLPAPAQAAAMFALALGLGYVAGSDVVPFIYARF